MLCPFRALCPVCPASCSTMITGAAGVYALGEAVETVGVPFAPLRFARNAWDTAFGCRLSSQVPSARDDNAPYGAITKRLRSGTLLAPKEYPEKCRCPQAADPRASQGAPAGTAAFPWRLRHSVLANAKSVAFAFTASRAQPVARRPPHGRARARCARRHTPPSYPNGPAKAGPRQNLHHSHAPPAMQQTPALTSQGGLGATPPLEITRSRTRRGARRMPLGAAMETPYPVRGVGLRRRPRCVSIGVAPCFCRRGLGASEHRRSENSALFIS